MVWGQPLHTQERSFFRCVCISKNKGVIGADQLKVNNGEVMQGVTFQVGPKIKRWKVSQTFLSSCIEQHNIWEKTIDYRGIAVVLEFLLSNPTILISFPIGCKFSSDFFRFFLWKSIWKVSLPLKVSFFSWEAPWVHTLTYNNLQKTELVSRCFLCKNEEESMTHLLLHCSWTR